MDCNVAKQVWLDNSLTSIRCAQLSKDESALGSDSTRQDRDWFVTGDASLWQA
jgi:hypothetical protein